jgi:eukaryotic-like serine/threonine-protein kinase
MALASGTKLGPYEIQSPLGAGGMGEVYRATDTRLQRTVAIKVLTPHLSGSPESRQRFEQEARAISSLNHPHICALYDIGRQGDTDFLVMEYADGETLERRLFKGALPLSQLLRYAIDIADALDKAHRQGVIHRDLKPANIMLTKIGAKLLDFGVARLMVHPAPVAIALTEMTAESRKLTAEGMLVGTLQYMAPEQLEATDVDARTDLFAFGAVLYEMATGKPAFSGKSRASLIAAILSSEPAPMGRLQPVVPPALERVVKKCLAKDPDERWQNAGDLKSELLWISESGSSALIPAPPRARRVAPQRVWMAVSILLALVVAVLGYLYYRRPAIEQDIVRASIEASPGTRFAFTSDLSGPPALSPDGRSLAYGAIDEGGTRRLWLRRLDSETAQPLPGTENSSYPFWSPDSRSVAFFADLKLKRIAVSGGLPIALCDVDMARGGSWGPDDIIVLSPGFHNSLSRVSASGGVPAPLTKLDTSKHTSHRWPQMLPDGRHFIYLAINHDALKAENDAIYWASLDGRENHIVARSIANAIYASGFLVYWLNNQLVAQAFDPAKGMLHGDAVSIAGAVEYDRSTWRASFTVSDSGVLAYHPGSGTNGAKMAWVDLAGKQLSTVGDSDLYNDLRLSPDGSRLALARGEPADIWIYDLKRGVGTRLTFDTAHAELGPVWSPDGRQIAFTADRNGKTEIHLKDANGAGEDRLLLQSTQSQSVDDWSPDGRFILYDQGETAQRQSIWAVTVSGDQKPFPVVQDVFQAQNGRFSPDGHFIAYHGAGVGSVGTFEVYVTRFAPPTDASQHDAGVGKWQVSNQGVLPIWRGDGRELFFLGLDNRLFAVPVETRGDNFQTGAARPLFMANFPSTGVPFDVSRDGKKIVIYAGQETASEPLRLVLNWFVRLKR